MAVNEILHRLESRATTLYVEPDIPTTLKVPDRATRRPTIIPKKQLEDASFGGATVLTAASVEEGSVKFSRRERLAYMLDQILSHRSAQIATLGTFMIFQVVVGGLVWVFVWSPNPSDPRDPDSQIPFFEGLWISWTFMADPGTHAEVYTPGQRIVGAFITFFGIIVMAALLGIVVDVIREKMDRLRQGKSKVVERGHSLILGWSEKAVLLIRELCIANESQGGGVVVVLGEESKEAMDVHLSVELPVQSRYNTKVVLRSGCPMLVSDLIKVGAHTARSIAILSGEGDSDKADAETLRCILSLRTLPSGFKAHIVAELRDIDNEGLVNVSGGESVETMVSHDVLGRLMLMSVRQPGLAKVYESLLGFEGDEFYVMEWPELDDIPFQSLIERFPDAIPIGVQRQGEVILNPDPDYRMRTGDELIVIAEDDDSYKPEPPREIEVGTPPEKRDIEQHMEKILLAGWRRDIRDILLHLDKLCKPGSELHMVSHSVPLDMRDEVLAKEGLHNHELHNILLLHHEINPTVRRQLVELPLEDFTSCMIFADQAFESDTMQADSHALATLLLIRDVQAARREEAIKRGKEPRPVCPAICEILDPRTQRTIAENEHVSNASEFCQTNKLTAQIVAMVCENRTVRALLDTLLGGSHCSVAVHSAERYCYPYEDVSFWTLAKRAMMFNEIIIGYHMAGASLPVVMNPKDKSVPMNWTGFNMAVIGPAEPALASRRTAGLRLDALGSEAYDGVEANAPEPAKPQCKPVEKPCDELTFEEEINHMSDVELKILNNTLRRLRQTVCDKVEERAVRTNNIPQMRTKPGLLSKRDTRY